MGAETIGHPAGGDRKGIQSMVKQVAPDWAAIEREYRETPVSIRALSKRHGVGYSTVQARSKAGQWEKRDQSADQIEAEKSAFEKVAEFSVTDLRILATTIGLPEKVDTEFDLADAARSLGRLAIAALFHLMATAKSEAVRRQAAHELLTWGYGKPMGIATGSTRRRAKPRVLGKKEALIDAAHNPDPREEMGRLMAERAAAVRKH